MSFDPDEFYSKNYKSFINTGAIGMVSHVTHLTLERVHWRRINNENLKVLEVGAGNCQHIKFVYGEFAEYVMSDLRPEMFPRTIERGTLMLDSVSAENIPFPDNSFDRLVATCLLAHMSNPDEALSEWRRVVKAGGIISIYVPCDPGLLLRLMQAVVSHPKKKKLGVFKPKLFHYREHKNSYVRLVEEIKNISGNLEIVRYPFPFLSWNLNLWAVFQVTVEKSQENARQMVEKQ